MKMPTPFRRALQNLVNEWDEVGMLEDVGQKPWLVRKRVGEYNT